MYRSILEAVLHHAETRPEALALADDREALSWAAYADRIRRMAAAFAARGIGKGDRVVIEDIQAADFPAAELALHLLGAVFVPVEQRCAAPKISQFAAASGAKLILTLREAAFDEAPCETLDAFAEEAKRTPPMAETNLPEGGEVNSILFSTGTTGAEKGITLSHTNDVMLSENIIAGVDLREDNVEFVLSPLNHAHGLRRYYANMYRGAAVILIGNLMNLKRFFAVLDLYRVTAISLVPSALAAILKLSGSRLGEYRHQLRYVQMGGAPMLRDSKEQLKALLPGVRLYNIYGSTESPINCVYDFNRPDEKERCIGRPTLHADVFVVDDNLNPIASSKDNPGTLAIRGPMNMLGYWKDPEETAKVLRDGVIYTNDIAYFDEDGDVILLGRRGDVINVGGKKVSPLEIEKAAGTLPGIADCGCVPADHPGKGSVPKLFVEMKPGAAFDAAALRSALAKLLEPFKVPDLIVQVEKIPRTFKGSLQRNKLKEME